LLGSGHIRKGTPEFGQPIYEYEYVPRYLHYSSFRLLLLDLYIIWRGIYDAFNKGVGLATGDIVGFLHSDDTFYSTDTLEYIAACFSTTPLPDGVVGDLVFSDRDNQPVRYW
jgi:hypothetical protein